MFGLYLSPSLDGDQDAVADRLDGKKIVIVATGSISAMYLPSWLYWLRKNVPTVEYRVVLTQSALNFVGRAAVRVYADHDLVIDRWTDGEARPLHVDLETWSDGYLIYPATVDYISRLANGLCNSPLLLSMQSEHSPVVAAAALPPYYLNSAVWSLLKEKLAARPNIEVVEPSRGESSALPGVESYPPRGFPYALSVLAKKISESNSPKEHVEQS